MLRKLTLVAAVIGGMTLFLFGCGGEVKSLQMRDAQQTVSQDKPVMKTVEFPKGTWTGAASAPQAVTLAQMFVESHNMAAAEFAKLKESQETLQKGQEAIKNTQQALTESAKRLEETNQKILETAQRHQENAQKTLIKIEELSKKQGTGEITLFYGTGKTRLPEKSLEYERLIRFADFLARESKGRKIVFISIGSASAFGPAKVNLKLAQKRADFPKTVLDKYLIHTPHTYFKVYGIGDLYSPKKVTFKEHERYQHTRLIALFENDPLPELPAEAPKK
jgi:hypothetical protein